jgi:N-acyl-D-aspartate/D-glutamate deacylase
MVYDLILRGGRVIDPSQKLDTVTDVAFTAGKVARVGPKLEAGPNTDVRDVSGLIVTPGLIDCTRMSTGEAPRSASMRRSSAGRPASPPPSIRAVQVRATSPASAST